jgi:rod shape-determining protein MreD
MPILYYFFAWATITFVQVVIVPRLSVLGIYPDLLTAAVIIIALTYGRIAGVWFGFAFAISIDLLDPMKMGWMTLLISLMGYLAGLIRDTIYIENPWFESTMIFLFTFLYQMLYRLLPAPQFFFENLLRMSIESFFIALYTVAVAGLVVWLMRQRHNIQGLA